MGRCTTDAVSDSPGLYNPSCANLYRVNPPSLVLEASSKIFSAFWVNICSHYGNPSLPNQTIAS